MRKFWLALATVAALSIGIAWGEGKNGKPDKAGIDCSGCCCTSKSCAK